MTSGSLGAACPESDLDLLVIEREVPDRYVEMIRLNGVLRGLIIAADEEPPCLRRPTSGSSQDARFNGRGLNLGGSHLRMTRAISC